MGFFGGKMKCDIFKWAERAFSESSLRNHGMKSPHQLGQKLWGSENLGQVLKWPQLHVTKPVSNERSLNP